MFSVMCVILFTGSDGLGGAGSVVHGPAGEFCVRRFRRPIVWVRVRSGGWSGGSWSGGLG